MIFFKNTEKAKFLKRKNRFIVECELNGKIVVAYLPNPGRLLELLYEGANLYLSPGMTAGKYKYTVIGVEKDNTPVMLHTHISNKVAKYLIEGNYLQDFKNVKILKEEFTIGKSRFDFLIEKDGSKRALEIKTCTLFHDGIAMFPDAVTERGARHLYELAEVKGSLIFLIQTTDVDYFLPEFNVDLNFAKAMLAVKDKVEIKAYAVKWKNDLSLDPTVKKIEIAWDIAEKHSIDSGCYLIILNLSTGRNIAVGEMGSISFKGGYYVYVGSAKKNLSKRVERHKKVLKKKFWHIDYLREKAEYLTALPIRTPFDLECVVANEVSKISDWFMKDFGCSDCKCKSHLFGFSKNPLQNRKFIDLILFYRIGILRQEMK
ncbi:MAG: hypothetical protein OHK0040_09400 [bacterium]